MISQVAARRYGRRPGPRRLETSPCDLDAERAVLGAVLVEGRVALPKVVEILQKPRTPILTSTG